MNDTEVPRFVRFLLLLAAGLFFLAGLLLGLVSGIGVLVWLILGEIGNRFEKNENSPYRVFNRIVGPVWPRSFYVGFVTGAFVWPIVAIVVF